MWPRLPATRWRGRLAERKWTRRVAATLEQLLWCAGWQSITLQRGRPLAIAEGRTRAMLTSAPAWVARRHLSRVNATFTAWRRVNPMLPTPPGIPRCMLIRSPTIVNAYPMRTARPRRKTPLGR